LADNPQQTIRELRELVIAYAKQETLDPILGLRKYAGFGLLGALLFGMGSLFLEIGLLRLLQDQTGDAFDGNWSWVPYAIVLVSSAAVAVLLWTVGTRKRAARTTP
jgi:hypothetical protein